MYFDGQFYKRLTNRGSAACGGICAVRGIEIITLPGAQAPPAPSEEGAGKPFSF